MLVLPVTARAATGGKPPAWPGTRLLPAPMAFSPLAAALLVSTCTSADGGSAVETGEHSRSLPAEEINTPNHQESMQLTSLTCKL
jgi:hypothetical protein